MKTLSIGWMLARPAGNGRGALVLPVVAFGVTTALLLIVLGGAQRFFSWHDDLAYTYQALAVVALALLVVPLVSLGGSAARLSARRRDDRLSTLRLLGATTGTVGALTVLESTVLALLGGIGGVALYAAVAPAVGLIPFRGEALGAAVWLPPLAVVGVVAGIGAIACVSAAVGLPRVIISPLGVRTRAVAPRVHWLRVVLGIVALFLAVMAMQVMTSFGSAAIIIAILAAVFGGAVAVLNLIGPFVLKMFGRSGAKRARTAQRLIAARNVLESPKAAWRQVSGIAMTSFMAVFAGTAVAVIGTMPNDPDSTALVADIRTGVVITLAASFLMVACSIGVNQAASILDRRDLYISLDRLGMPLTQMDAARTRTVMSPLRIVTLGSALVAVVVIMPLAGLALIVAPVSVLVIAGCLAAGILLAWLGVVATRPLLRAALREPQSSLPT